MLVFVKGLHTLDGETAQPWGDLKRGENACALSVARNRACILQGSFFSLVLDKVFLKVGTPSVVRRGPFRACSPHSSMGGLTERVQALTQRCHHPVAASHPTLLRSLSWWPLSVLF